jgi:hypothetical protein
VVQESEKASQRSVQVEEQKAESLLSADGSAGPAASARSISKERAVSSNVNAGTKEQAIDELYRFIGLDGNKDVIWRSMRVVQDQAIGL